MASTSKTASKKQPEAHYSQNDRFAWLIPFIAVVVVASNILGIFALSKLGDSIDTNKKGIATINQIVCSLGKIVPAPQGAHESDANYLKRLNSYSEARALLKVTDCKTAQAKLAEFQRDHPNATNKQIADIIGGPVVTPNGTIVLPANHPVSGGGGNGSNGSGSNGQPGSTGTGSTGGGSTGGGGSGGATTPPKPPSILDNTQGLLNDILNNAKNQCQGINQPAVC